jgi:hypothetical protein
MPRYFFSTSDSAAADARGVDLPNLDAARQHALRTLGGLLFDEILMGHDDIAVEMHIGDEKGGRIATLRSSTRIAFAATRQETVQPEFVTAVGQTSQNARDAISNGL